MTGVTPFIKRGIRHVETVTLYPSQLGVGIWYNPRAALYERSKIPLAASEEFRLQMLRDPLTLPAAKRWSLPLSFSVYEVSHRVSRNAMEWEKIQALPLSHTFFEPWMPLAIYEAYRKGIIGSLIQKEDSVNTFYTRQCLSVQAVDIESYDCHEPTPCWYIYSRGMGDEQVYFDSQRIFVRN